ncbi:hypothetical protein VSDG_05076 [Cytospora chrysosperma]|uniref:Uncharacterized protein n=1 Tax=Cytospora chrysosperma TaxID=252740 RepID=A0A423VYI2_CYTCH|nr:hypothetical protein VSDG_05076 [Valsa sordida]
MSDSANLTVSEQFEQAIQRGQNAALGPPPAPAPAPAGPDMLQMLPVEVRRQVFRDRLVDPNTRIELDNLRPDPSFYISQRLGAEALSVYTQENAFTANVCSNYRDIYLIRKKIAKGTWDRAKFRNPGQPRRHRLIPRKAGTAQLPGSRLVTSRAWTAADLAYTSGKLRTTRRSFLRRPEVRFREVDIVVQGLQSGNPHWARGSHETSVLELEVVRGELVMNATPPIQIPPYLAGGTLAAVGGWSGDRRYRKFCWAMHKKARSVARRIYRAELAANNGAFEGFTLQHLKQIAGAFVYWP